MQYDFFDYSVFEGMDDAIGSMFITVLIIWLSFFLAMMLATVVLYVLRSVGMYTIAKRRGIHHPWLAWIPVGEVWVLGSISDQYQYVARGKIRSRRKLLLGGAIVMKALSVLSVIWQMVATAIMIGEGETGSTAGILMIVVCTLVMAAIGIAYTVFYFIAQYDMYRSCDPNNAVAYLVLGIFFPFMKWIFPFVCRKKDLGMPPRRTRSVQEPAVIPEQTEPAPAEPAEAPAQPEEPSDAVAEEADVADSVTEETSASDEETEA